MKNLYLKNIQKTNLSSFCQCHKLAQLNAKFKFIAAGQTLADYSVQFTTENCNWYEQLTYFVFIVLPGIVEFSNKDMTFFGN